MLLFGPILLVLRPLVALVALVGWARWRVGAHHMAMLLREQEPQMAFSYARQRAIN